MLVDESVSGLGTAGVRHWTLGDHIGSIRDVINDNGGMELHRLFNAYGQSSIAQGDPATYTPLFSFTARPFDLATLLQSNGNRWYDALVGRWLSEDPIGFGAEDANLYRYVGNRPVTYVDPAGLARVVVAVEGFGAKLGTSSRFVKASSPIGRVVAGWVKTQDWHYFFQIQAALGNKTIRNKVIAEAEKPIKQPDGTICYNTIILVGFSHGGDAVYRVAKQLEAKSIRVDLVLTLDPVPRPIENAGKRNPNYAKPPNVDHWLNYYQDLQILHGWGVQGAETNRRLTNTSKTPTWEDVSRGKELEAIQGLSMMVVSPKKGLDGLKSSSYTEAHSSIPQLAEVLNQFRSRVMQLPEVRKDYIYYKPVPK